MSANQRTFWEMTSPAQLPFKQWKLREGERLYNQGAQQLSSTELLAHVTRDQQVAERLMQDRGAMLARPSALEHLKLLQMRRLMNCSRSRAWGKQWRKRLSRLLNWDDGL